MEDDQLEAGIGRDDRLRRGHDIPQACGRMFHSAIDELEGGGAFGSIRCSESLDVVEIDLIYEHHDSLPFAFGRLVFLSIASAMLSSAVATPSNVSPMRG